MNGSPAPDVRGRAAVSIAAAALDDLADDATRNWWTRYLKGEAAFRGVKMAGVRTIARRIQDELALADVPIDELFDIADGLFAVATTEDKLCAVLLLAEHHLHRLTTTHVDRLAAPLAAGYLADWNSCDWYCVKVLGPFVAADDHEARARAIASWRDAEGLWQRRAAAVAFVDLVTRPPLFDGFDELVVDVCTRNVADPTRWSQTSVGWVLRELSIRSPAVVRRFVDEHGAEMSTEARRAATKRL